MGRQAHVDLVLQEVIQALLLFFDVLGILGKSQCDCRGNSLQLLHMSLLYV